MSSLSVLDRDAIREKLKSILTSAEFSSLQVDVSTLDDDASLLNDIALDSLQLLEFVVAMERTFGFKLETKRLSLDIFDRFDRVIDLVESNLIRHSMPV
jgi:acyl carrier protein